MGCLVDGWCSLTTVSQDREEKVLLLLDNYTAYHMKPPLEAVTLLLLSSNATLRVQLLYLRINQNFKLCYRHQLVELLSLSQPVAALSGMKLPLPMIKAS